MKFDPTAQSGPYHPRQLDVLELSTMIDGAVMLAARQVEWTTLLPDRGGMDAASVRVLVEPQCINQDCQSECFMVETDEGCRIVAEDITESVMSQDLADVLGRIRAAWRVAARAPEAAAPSVSLHVELAPPGYPWDLWSIDFRHHTGCTLKIRIGPCEYRHWTWSGDRWQRDHHCKMNEHLRLEEEAALEVMLGAAP